MSSYLSDEEEELLCPLCMEEIDIADRNFKPCSCGYQICRFCWNHILEEMNGLCPACRRPYSKETVEFTPIPQEELQSIKAKKRAKERERREQEQNARKHLSNVRVVQKNLVYVIGMPPKLATEETIRQHNYFGKYGKITKVVINKKTHNTPQGTSTNISIYITYAKKEDATKAIIAVDGTSCEGRTIKASYGTTKYCTNYLKGQQCQNPNCMYLHEPGEEADSYSKEKDETLNQGKHNLQKELSSSKSFPYKEKTYKVVNSSSFNKDDNKEEGSALPVTASWAKLTKSSSSNSSLNKIANSKASSEKAYSSSGQIKSSSKTDLHKVAGSSSQSLISSTSNLSNNSSSTSLNKALDNTSSNASLNANSITNNKHVHSNSSDQEDNSITKTEKSSNSSLNTPSISTANSSVNINEIKITETTTSSDKAKSQNTTQTKSTIQTTASSNNSNNNSQVSLNTKPKTFKIVYEDTYTGSSALSDNSNEDEVPPNAINNLQHKYEGPFDPFCEDPFHFTDEEIFTALAKLQQKLRLASFESYQQQLMNQNYNAGTNNKNINRLQKLYSNPTIPLQMKAAMLSPEISPENKLSRMMSTNANNNDIAASLNNIIKRKLPNSDDVRNLFNNQNNMYQNNMLSNTASQNLPMGAADNWNEMNLPNQQQQQQYQNIQSLNSLVMNNTGGQYNAAAAAASSNYNNMQRLHSLQGINTNMNANGNNMNYVNSMISPELEYQNSVQQQYQSYNFTPRQQQAFMNTNQHPSQQQQQLYQRMNNTTNANSQQQLPGEFFGQMLQHQKQNVQPHGQNSIMNIPFQDPAIMAVRMSGNGQTASPYDNAAAQMSPLEYLNSFNQNKK